MKRKYLGKKQGSVYRWWEKIHQKVCACVERKSDWARSVTCPIVFLAFLSPISRLPASELGITASPTPPQDPGHHLYNQEVTLTLNEPDPAPTPEQCPPDGTWTLQSKEYEWSGNVTEIPGNSPTNFLDTQIKGQLSAVGKIRWHFSSGMLMDVATVRQATYTVSTGCPRFVVNPLNAQCGVTYGAWFRVETVPKAINWWFYEQVTANIGNCGSGTIGQNSNPSQTPTGVIRDDIENSNGPPALVAPCTDNASQWIYFGPTQARANDCGYNANLIIQVQAGLVTTTHGNASTSCSY